MSLAYLYAVFLGDIFIVYLNLGLVVIPGYVYTVVYTTFLLLGSFIGPGFPKFEWDGNRGSYFSLEKGKEESKVAAGSDAFNEDLNLPFYSSYPFESPRLLTLLGLVKFYFYLSWYFIWYFYILLFFLFLRESTLWNSKYKVFNKKQRRSPKVYSDLRLFYIWWYRCLQEGFQFNLSFNYFWGTYFKVFKNSFKSRSFEKKDLVDLTFWWWAIAEVVLGYRAACKSYASEFLAIPFNTRSRKVYTSSMLWYFTATELIFGNRLIFRYMFWWNNRAWSEGYSSRLHSKNSFDPLKITFTSRMKSVGDLQRFWSVSEEDRNEHVGFIDPNHNNNYFMDNYIYDLPYEEFLYPFEYFNRKHSMLHPSESQWFSWYYGSFFFNWRSRVQSHPWSDWTARVVFYPKKSLGVYFYEILKRVPFSLEVKVHTLEGYSFFFKHLHQFFFIQIRKYFSILFVVPSSVSQVWTLFFWRSFRLFELLYWLPHFLLLTFIKFLVFYFIYLRSWLWSLKLNLVWVYSSYIEFWFFLYSFKFYLKTSKISIKWFLFCFHYYVLLILKVYPSVPFKFILRFFFTFIWPYFIFIKVGLVEWSKLHLNFLICIVKNPSWNWVRRMLFSYKPWISFRERGPDIYYFLGYIPFYLYTRRFLYIFYSFLFFCQWKVYVWVLVFLAWETS